MVYFWLLTKQHIVHERSDVSIVTCKFWIFIPKQLQSFCLVSPQPRSLDCPEVQESHMCLSKSTQLNLVISIKWVRISVSSYFILIFNYVALIINNITHMKGFCFTLMKKTHSSFSSFILAPRNLCSSILKAVGSIWYAVCLLNSEQLHYWEKLSFSWEGMGRECVHLSLTKKMYRMSTIYLRCSGGPSVSISKDVLKSNFQGRQIYSH